MKLLRSILILIVLGLQIQVEQALPLSAHFKQVVGYIGNTLDNKTTRYYGNLVRDCSSTISSTIIQSFQKSFSGIRNSLSSLVPSWGNKSSITQSKSNDLTCDDAQSLPQTIKAQNSHQNPDVMKYFNGNDEYNDVTFEQVLLILKPANDVDVQKLDNKKFRHKACTLIADNFMSLVKWATLLSYTDLLIVSIQLGRIFNDIDNEKDIYNESRLKKTVSNNCGELINTLVLYKDLTILLRDWFERFLFFEEHNNSQELSDDHYTMIFLDKRFFGLNKYLVIERLLSISSSKKEKTLEFIEKHIDELKLDIIDLILEQLGSVDDTERLLRLLYNKNKNNFLKLVMIKKWGKKYCPSVEFDVPCNTIHERNLIKNINLVTPSSIVSSYAQNIQLKTLFDKINEKTKELQEDYYIFVHGQNIQFYPLEQWYTALRSLVEGCQIPQDYCYPWIEQLSAQDNYSFWYGDPREMLLHEELKYRGTYKKVLFMNSAFFDNIGVDGASSAYYFCKNKNAYLTKDLHMKYFHDIFDLLTLNAFYEKYKTRLEKHAAQFDQLSNYGNMLLIAVPKDKISQSVYFGNSFAGRRKMTIKGIGETDDIALIMEVLENNPEMIEEKSFEIHFNKKFMEFCLLMTQSPHGGGLNPESGIKIIPFNCIQPEKLQQFEQEKDELLALIKEDIEAIKKAKSNKYKALPMSGKL